MKPLAYCPIIGLILSILILSALTDWIDHAVPRDRSQSFAFGMLAFGISAGATIGFAIQRKKKAYRVLRPIQYWPLIGILAAVFTKGSMWSDWWYYIFPFWISVGLAVGLLVEWKTRAALRRKQSDREEKANQSPEQKR